jgi:hypothetical protein
MLYTPEVMQAIKNSQPLTTEQLKALAHVCKTLEESVKNEEMTSLQAEAFLIHLLR